MESMGAGIPALIVVFAVLLLAIAGVIVWAVRAARASREHEEQLRFGDLSVGDVHDANESGSPPAAARVPVTSLSPAATPPAAIPPAESFAPAPEPAAAPAAFGPNDTVRVTPLGHDTELDYLRLAAEPVQPPPPAPLGVSNASRLFSWTAAVNEGDLDELTEADRSADAAVPESGAQPRSWELVLPDGSTIPLAADNVIGRNPVAAAGVHPIVIPDPTRTLSKTHVRLRLSGETWVVEDLGSTNGVVLVHEDDAEQQLEARQPVVASRRMLFGTLPVLLRGSAG